jgi:hypothetical protein
MNDPRIYRVTMPDGSEWDVPVQTFIEDWCSTQTDSLCGIDIDTDGMAALLGRGHAAFATPEHIHEYAVTIPWDDLAKNDLVSPHKVDDRQDPSKYQEGWKTGPWKVVTPCDPAA